MIRIGLVDDHTLFRKGISLVIQTFAGMEVVIDASNGKELIEKLQLTTLDVVLLDIRMPIMNGFETCTILHNLFPDIKILAVTQMASRDTVHKILECGAHGYFSKSSDVAQLEVAIHRLNSKGFYFDSEMGPLLREIIFWDDSIKEENPLSMLSEKELKIIKMVSLGYNNKAIADSLFISIRTVETYRKRITEKTGAKNFTNVIIWAIKYQYLAVEDL